MRNYSIDTACQRQRLLKALRKKPLSTLEIRHKLDILGVAPRIYELRHKHGYNIQTQWIKHANPGGGPHLVAHYVLRPGKWQEHAEARVYNFYSCANVIH